jgi:DNA modification methylase
VGYFSKKGDIALDIFSGVGTTCVAAKLLGRRYIGIDISEEYCQIARQRLEAVDTGVPVKEQRKGQQALFA